MLDRVKIGNGKSSFLKLAGVTSSTTWEEFRALLLETHGENSGAYCDVVPNDALGTDSGVSVVGTALNTDNLLSDEVAEDFGFQSTADATPTGAFEKILDRWDKEDAVYYATFASSGWSNSAPYSQTVIVSGALASWTHPIYDLFIENSTSAVDGAEEADAFSLVNKMVVNDGSVTLYCYGNKPQKTFKIMLAKG